MELLMLAAGALAMTLFLLIDKLDAVLDVFLPAEDPLEQFDPAEDSMERFEDAEDSVERFEDA